ncbi:hypothetical protein EDD28_1771 [Salana multivorans]|uniref:Uncharacterized protein n=1 Tax=Salana multivorans TaxID=120377 RepID=A0A3N2DBZ4_9MICO|nr:hypothetical protein EDD28_1771 [Salana multivorans]
MPPATSRARRGYAAASSVPRSSQGTRGGRRGEPCGAGHRGGAAVVARPVRGDVVRPSLGGCSDAGAAPARSLTVRGRGGRAAWVPGCRIRRGAGCRIAVPGCPDHRAEGPRAARVPARRGGGGPAVGVGVGRPSATATGRAPGREGGLADGPSRPSAGVLRRSRGRSGWGADAQQGGGEGPEEGVPARPRPHHPSAVGPRRRATIAAPATGHAGNPEGSGRRRSRGAVVVDDVDGCVRQGELGAARSGTRRPRLRTGSRAPPVRAPRDATPTATVADARPPCSGRGATARARGRGGARPRRGSAAGGRRAVRDDLVGPGEQLGDER